MGSRADDMSSATKEVLNKVRQMVPPMLEKFHKGQLGRVAVIGGSKDYTGAPYFSAMASARLGCDMSHVICTSAAAAVIKTYSPNLMVHPLMRQTDDSASSDSSAPGPVEEARNAAQPVIDMLGRLHVLVIGPGLGRDEAMHQTCEKVLAAARERSIPVVIDADALAIVTRSPDLVDGWREVVLTPNVVEFARLWRGVFPNDNDNDASEGKEGAGRVEKLAKALGGVTIVQKGAKDYVSNGTTTIVVDLPGGLKRSGGQGDTLTGCIATFLAWRKAYRDRIWDHAGELGDAETLGLAAFAGAAVTRECSRLAFEKHGRSLQASDLTEQVHVAFVNLLGEPTS
ncbi:H-hydrate dehydratase [Nemania sp. FL0916]|nr:H-hydrate dehydratase [Nemania sp. FL0916]